MGFCYNFVIIRLRRFVLFCNILLAFGTYIWSGFPVCSLNLSGRGSLYFVQTTIECLLLFAFWVWLRYCCFIWAERRSTQREKDIRHEKTHISVRLGSSFCFVRVCDFDYSLVVCTDFGCDRHGCNTCLRKMGRQLLSSGNGGHNAEKAARLFVAWSGRNCCRIGIALCYPGGK